MVLIHRFCAPYFKLLSHFTCHFVFQKVTSLHRGEQLYDILFIEQCHGLELPKWTDKVYPDQLLALVERNMAILTENQFMKRVKGGK